MATESSGMVESSSTTPQRSALLTFLIADVRGYTRFTVEQGNEAAARLASTFAAIARAVVAARGGEVIELRGDEALAVFPSARNALYAAVELQAHFREQLEVDPALPLKVGIGIDAGEAVPVEGGYRGLALNLAARLCSLAGPGEVYGSEGVVQRAQRLEGLAYVERGRVSLKGFADPIRVIQILPEDDLPAGFPPLVSLIAKPSNLPLQPTPFIGREREVEAVTSLLRREEVRLLTLTGTGGTGKTRLALQVGGAVLDDFERGVFFVSLGSITDSSLIPSTIAGTLKVKETPGESLVETLCNNLRDKQMLLVLDNFEHLLEGAPVVSELLAACPELKVLITSRAVLHLGGEYDYPVPPLSVPDPKHLPDVQTLSQYDAVALFIQRAQAAKPDFAVTNDNAPAVAEICHRLDGLPLAIELAAARIRLLPAQALLARLSSRLKLLTRGARDAPSRQQTLRGTIDWSYGLLDEGEQRLFARLSVFQGGCDLEAVEAVCNAEGELDVLEGMSSLVDQSLLRQQGDDEPRFAMLETIREYATERLEASDAADAVRHHHSTYFLELAEEGQRHFEGRDQVLWQERLKAEHDNLRVAMAWSLERREPESALRGAIAVSTFCLIQGYLTEARRWVETALAAKYIDPGRRAEALNLLARIAIFQGDYQRSAQLMEESLRLAREVGDTRGVAQALQHLGVFASSRGSMGDAAELWMESLRLFREVADRQGLALVLLSLGSRAIRMGHYDEAEGHIQESLALYRDMGDAFQTAYALLSLGALERERGQHDRAREHCEEALEVFRSAEYPWGIANALEWLAHLALAQGNFGEAIARAEEALKLLREMELGRAQRGSVLYILGIALGELGALERAITTLRESLSSCWERGVKPRVVSCLEGVAGIYSRTGQAERAVRLFGVASKMREDIGIPLLASERLRHESHVAATRAEVDEGTWQSLWEEGQAMSLEAAIACALDEGMQVRLEADQALSVSPGDPGQHPRYSSDQV
jgi:predicted ATPase/class 3 adenylate cyclase